jgi:hypothetical protein
MVMDIQNASGQLLTDPFLQNPQTDGVTVVWFTPFPGTDHWVTYGANGQHQVKATTTQMSRLREDQDSRLGSWVPVPDVNRSPELASSSPELASSSPEPDFQAPGVWQRSIWRHEATITNLQPGESVPYCVTSKPLIIELPDASPDKSSDPESPNLSSQYLDSPVYTVQSDMFHLSPAPLPGTPLKILLTSDHQLKPMVAANLQKVVETVGQVDAVFLAGDLVNIPDRASEWFDDDQGGLFSRLYRVVPGINWDQKDQKDQKTKKSPIGVEP